MNTIRGLFTSMDISASGLSAQRRRMNAIAENIANVNTTRTEEGGPYRRKISFFSEDRQGVEIYRAEPIQGNELDVQFTDGKHLSGGGQQTVDQRFSGVNYHQTRDNTEPELVYDPQHPDADDEGYVAMPKIDVVQEMVDMIAASRAYEANATAIESAKSMAKKAMTI